MCLHASSKRHPWGFYAEQAYFSISTLPLENEDMIASLFLTESRFDVLIDYFAYILSVESVSSKTLHDVIYHIKHKRQCSIWKQTPRVENTTHCRVFFDEIRGVWIANETLSCV